MPLANFIPLPQAASPPQEVMILIIALMVTQALSLLQEPMAYPLMQTLITYLIIIIPLTLKLLLLMMIIALPLLAAESMMDK